jgi:hypothetical protein
MNCMKLTNFGLNIRLLLTFYLVTKRLLRFRIGKKFRIIPAVLHNLKGQSQNSDPNLDT